MFLHLSMLVGHHLGFLLNINPLYLGLALSITGIIVVVIILILHNYCKTPLSPQPQVWVNDGLAHPASIGLDPSILETFPIFNYSEVAAHRDDTGPLECSVCLSPFEADETLRLLPQCNHIFHVTCLDPWLKDHTTCPLCRAYLVPEPNELTLVDVGGVDQLGGEVENHNVLEVRPERDVEEGLFGKHKRWNSTGHFAIVVEPMEMKSWERFTLRLPEEDVGKCGVKTSKFRRTRSSL